jgi:hypothetical protein
MDTLYDASLTSRARIISLPRPSFLPPFLTVSLSLLSSLLFHINVKSLRALSLSLSLSLCTQRLRRAISAIQTLPMPLPSFVSLLPLNDLIS